MVDLLNRIHNQSLSQNNARAVFALLWAGETDIDAIIAREGYENVDDSAALEEMIQQLILQFPEQNRRISRRKREIISIFCWTNHEKTKGQANPELVNSLLKQHLAS